MLKQVSYSTPYLPEDKARYVMGVGTPVQLLKMIGMGADMFDCVMPTVWHAMLMCSRLLG